VKGFVEDPMSAIAVFGAIIVLVPIINGFAVRSGDFLKEQAVDVQADRVVNAALAADSMEEGQLALEMEGYEFKYSKTDQKVYIRYRDSVGNATMELFEGSFTSISGPDTFTEVEEEIILVKNSDDRSGAESLDFYVDELPDDAIRNPATELDYQNRINRCASGTGGC
jgi:hypothetical protein